jgi:predicted nucleotidyltransferase
MKMLAFISSVLGHIKDFIVWGKQWYSSYKERQLKAKISEKLNKKDNNYFERILSDWLHNDKK